MSKGRWLGLASIKIGTVNLSDDTTTNYMPSTFTTIQNFVPDSASFIAEQADQTRIYVEDSSDPDILLNSGDRIKHIEFATRDMDLDNTFLLGFGGSVNGTTDVWSAPTTDPISQPKAVEAITTPIDGFSFKIEIPNGAMRANSELRFYNRNPDTGEVGFDIGVQKAVTDGDTTVAPYKVTRITA